MDLRHKSVAIYGRCTAGMRERFAAEIARRGGVVARDLTRQSDIFVVGALAFPLVDAGHLTARLASARKRRVPVFAERAFDEALRGVAGETPSLPLASIQGVLPSRDAVELFAVFDVVRLHGECCRFRDADALRAGSELVAGGRSLGEAVRILTKARDHAPKGRRKLVLDGGGRPVLRWETGLTTLDGQGFLPLEDSAPSMEDLFEAAAGAEAEGETDAAARLYEIAARLDADDPIAWFNLGNLKLAAGEFADAALAFRRAIARDQKFVEARYNLAAACERLEKPELARDQLIEALRIDPGYADARFNLAQLQLKRGALAEAKAEFERYLSADPPADWADKARRAIRYCAAANRA